MIGIATWRAYPFMRAYTNPAISSVRQPSAEVQTYGRRLSVGAALVIGFFSFSMIMLLGQEPPPGLARKVAHRESLTQAERNQYAYRQTVRLQELDNRGSAQGEYREVRDIIFSPERDRTEQAIGTPQMTLKRLMMTEEDFRDIRDVQPFVLTDDVMFIYETKFRGDEVMDGQDCWVLQVRPRQILDKQRLFDGTLWVKKDDYSVVRSEGQAVPQIRTATSENLFPKFTTVRHQVNGFWFPTMTYSDDTLYFKNAAQRQRLTIHYSDYKRFGSESSISFEKP